jgi:hypothetical protein
MSSPVAQQIISSMKIIMGEDGTDEGSTYFHLHALQPIRSVPAQGRRKHQKVGGRGVFEGHFLKEKGT